MTNNDLVWKLHQQFFFVCFFFNSVFFFLLSESIEIAWLSLTLKASKCNSNTFFFLLFLSSNMWFPVCQKTKFEKSAFVSQVVNDCYRHFCRLPVSHCSEMRIKNLNQIRQESWHVTSWLDRRVYNAVPPPCHRLRSVAGHHSRLSAAPLFSAWRPPLSEPRCCQPHRHPLLILWEVSTRTWPAIPDLRATFNISPRPW